MKNTACIPPNLDESDLSTLYRNPRETIDLAIRTSMSSYEYARKFGSSDVNGKQKLINKYQILITPTITNKPTKPLLQLLCSSIPNCQLMQMLLYPLPPLPIELLLDLPLQISLHQHQLPGMGQLLFVQPK